MASTGTGTGSQSASSTDVARAIFAALNDHDIAAMLAHDDPEVVDDFVPIGELRGHAVIRGFFTELFGAVPDVRFDVEHVSGSGEDAVVQWRLTGAFTGAPFQGIRATGRRVELRGVDVMVIRAGRLVHNTIYYDGLAFVRQVGLLPREGSAGDRALTGMFNARTALVQAVRRR